LNTPTLTPPVENPPVENLPVENPTAEEPTEMIEPFTTNELNPSNWTLTPLEEDLILCKNSVTNREETLTMEEFNLLMRG
jgi:hypothetical protein